MYYVFLQDTTESCLYKVKKYNEQVKNAIEFASWCNTVRLVFDKEPVFLNHEMDSINEIINELEWKVNSVDWEWKYEGDKEEAVGHLAILKECV